MRQPTSPRNSIRKSLAAGLVLSSERRLGPRPVAALSRLAPVVPLMRTVRHVMVSRALGTIYIPVPKCATTLFATLLVVHGETSASYDPDQGVHGYRYRTRALELRDYRLLSDPGFFVFTVVRSPFSRLVSAYLDKLVKPRRDGRFRPGPGDEGRFQTDLTFQDLVRWLARTPDHRIEKHWRPQATFLGDIRFDHVGCLERMGRTHEVVRDRLGIDIETEVLPRVKRIKTTEYDGGIGGAPGDAARAPPAELAGLDLFPRPERFYTPELERKVAMRFRRDVELWERAVAEADATPRTTGAGVAAGRVTVDLS